MSGRVDVLAELEGGFVVACFNDACWEHGEWGCSEPWVSEHPSRAAAQIAASRHRQRIRNQGVASCPTCKQPTTQPRTPAGSPEEATS